MADENDIEPPAEPNRRWDFYLSRIHSLFGMVPVGVFLCVHLTLNATILAGAEKYQNAVKAVHLLEQIGLLIPIEVFFILVPLLFHALFGVVILLKGTVNLRAYRHWGNYRYVLQRATGAALFVFIIFHLWHMHWLGKPFGGAYFNPENAPLTAALAIQSSPVSAVLYVLGVIIAAFHLANGLWSASITWGVIIGANSQRNWGYLCAVAGIGLGVLGTAAAWGLLAFR